MVSQRSSGSAGGGGQSKTQQAEQKVEEKAGQVADQARQQAMSRAESGKDQAAEQLSTVASAVRQTSEQLRQQNKDSIADYVDMGAERAERLAAALRERDVNQLLHDAAELPRRSPGLFVGGAFALGILSTRFLKSSSQQTGGTGQPVGAGQGYEPVPATGYGAAAYPSGIDSGIDETVPPATGYGTAAYPPDADDVASAETSERDAYAPRSPGLEG
jgi:hypothetical protein